MMTRISLCAVLLLLLFLPAQNRLHSLSLREVIASALRTCDETEISRLAERVLRLEKRRAIREFFPRASLGFSGSNTVVYSRPDSRRYRLYAALKQPVSTGGVLLERLGRAEDALAVQQHAVRGSENALLFGAIADFTGLIKLESEITTLTAVESLLAQQVRMAEQELSLGLITEHVYQKMRLALDRHRISRRSAESEYLLVMDNLYDTLGLEQPPFPRPGGKINPGYRGIFGTEEGPAPGLEDLLTSARANHPEIAGLDREAAAAERHWRNRRRFWVPRFSVAGEVFASGDRLPLTNPGFSVSLEMVVPVPFVPITFSISFGSGQPDSRTLSIAGGADEDPGRSETLLAARHASEEARLVQSRTWDRLSKEITAGRTRLCYSGELLLRELSLLVLIKDETVIAAEELALGEIGRQEYMEAEAEYGRHTAEVLERQYAVFLKELELLALCGYRLKDSPEALLLYRAFLEEGL